MSRPRVCLCVVGILALRGSLQVVGAAQPPYLQQESSWDEALLGPLPRWREGPLPDLDSARSLHPAAVTRREALRAPSSGLMASPPEYSPTDGVIFRYSTSAWPQVVVDCVVQLTRFAAYDEIAYVVVSNVSQMNSATSQFLAGGANMSKVQFLIMPSDSIWLRDYGPHFVWQSPALAIVDSQYYPTRPLDNFIPTLLASDALRVPSYDMGLYYSGGNFQPGPARSGFMTTLIYLDNPEMNQAFISQLMNTYQGIDTMHFMPQLPWSVDGTGHIDMWLYLVDDDTVIISEFLPGSNATAIAITNNAVPYMEALGFEVFRTPAHNAGGVHYTYTNAYRVNNRIFIPSYRVGGSDYLARDVQAQATWEAACPECDIVPINSWDIIPAAGAIHCIMMQVPRYTNATPGVHVVTPYDQQLLAGGEVFDLQWSAIDDTAVTSIDLLLSTDGGATFPEVIATSQPNDGHLDWTVPEGPATGGVIKAIAYDEGGLWSEATSPGAFEITLAPQTVYDFSMGASNDRWAWGHQTISWSSVDGQRRPAEASAEIDTLVAGAYGKIAYPDASGGDTDANRYSSPTPSSGRESTHIFEFTIAEDPATILDLGIRWEGYADDCTQMELYVWDLQAGQWCDGTGQCGQNHFMDNFAGNLDRAISGHIRQDLDRYIDPDGLLTLLLYAERTGDKSFHDYVAVTVTYRGTGDLNGDGLVNPTDLALLLGSWGPCADCVADLDGDGNVGAADLALLLGHWAA